MKFLQKLCTVTMILGLLLCLAGCGRVPQSDEEDRQQLIAILDSIAADLHPGTAGSSLVSARCTADLIAWASTTRMSRQEAGQIVGQWLEEQSPQIRQAFQEQLASVQDSFSTIVTDGAKGLLEAAGVEQDLSNLGSRLKDIVTSILNSGGLD